jgi:hypothetical protein
MDTLKFAAAAADAINAPVRALSCTPNSIPISARRVADRPELGDQARRSRGNRRGRLLKMSYRSAPPKSDHPFRGRASPARQAAHRPRPARCHLFERELHQALYHDPPTFLSPAADAWRPQCQGRTASCQQRPGRHSRHVHDASECSACARRHPRPSVRICGEPRARPLIPLGRPAAERRVN